MEYKNALINSPFQLFDCGNYNCLESTLKIGLGRGGFFVLFVVCLLIRCFGSHSFPVLDLHVVVSIHEENTLLVCTESESMCGIVSTKNCSKFSVSLAKPAFCVVFQSLYPKNKSETILNSQRSMSHARTHSHLSQP